jgi:hypothetical protein
MITAMSAAGTVMIAILTMTGSWCADARSVRITERMDGMNNKKNASLNRMEFAGIYICTELFVMDIEKNAN